MRTSQTTRALRRAVTVLAAVGALALGGLATSAPAAAAKAVNVDNVKVTSKSTDGWSSVVVKADWSADSPSKGDTLTITLGQGLRWDARLNFPLTSEQDKNLVIGDCVADRGSNVLTCTLNDKVQQWDKVNGALEAYAQFNQDMVGKDKTSLTVNGKTATVVAGDSDGDGTCDVACGPVTPERVNKSTYKAGWLGKFEKGTYTWHWAVNVTGSTSYKVTDPEATFSSVQCAKGTYWDTNAFTPKDAKKDPSTNEISWTVDSADTVCRVWFNSTSGSGSAKNTATVNGQDLTANAQAFAQGSGWGTGSKNSNTPPASPAPSATPSASPAPSATPSASPAPSASPTPSSPGCSHPSTPAPGSPSAPPSSGSGCPKPSHSASSSLPPSDSGTGGTPPSQAAPGGNGDQGNQGGNGDQGNQPGGNAGNPGASASAGSTSSAGGLTVSKPNTGKNGGGLASTGASIAIAGGAIAALLAGGGALYLARRRRS